MVNLASGLEAQGQQVEFVLVRAEGQFLADVPVGVTIIDLEARRAIFALPALIRYLRTQHPDVLLTALDNASVIAVLAKYLSHVTTQVVVSVHAPLSWTHGRANSIFGKIFKWLIQWSYPRASAVVAVSEGVRHDLVRNFGLDRHKVHTIYNPIIDTRLQEMGSQVPDHRWFGPQQVPVILAVGRLSVEKDYPTLIRAFYLVRQQRPARLLILGEGDEKARLQALVSELGLAQDVELVGFTANPYAFMKQVSCYALPSTFEGFGNVLVEALAMGCRVVSTNCPGGPAEILNGGEFGHMVPVGDSAAMATALLETLEDDHRPSSSPPLMAHLQKFEVQNVAGKYAALFDSLRR
jgi:glycosyltransferase involved in cell wall biosynthesis